MILGAVLLAGAVAASTPSPPTPPELFRLELAGNQTIWAQDRPLQSGGLVLFHRYPDGVLLSIKRVDLRRIAVVKQQAAARALKPGSTVELGATGGAGMTATGGGASAGAPGPLPPGERRDGTALLNPDRPYKPEWDSKQVPGMNIPLPASANDYREGRTFAFPPAPATQAAPGDLPRAPVETGEPKSPQ